MTSPVDSAIRDFYAKAVELQNKSATQMRELAQTVMQGNPALAREEK